MEFNATFLISTISFVAFVLIMNRILYAPMSQIVEKRKAYLDANAAEAEKNQTKAQEILADKDAKIADTKAQAKGKVAVEMEKNKQIKLETAKNKKVELTEAVSNHKKELDDEKSALTSDLKGRAQEIADTILGKIGGGNV